MEVLKQAGVINYHVLHVLKEGPSSTHECPKSTVTIRTYHLGATTKVLPLSDGRGITVDPRSLYFNRARFKTVCCCKHGNRPRNCLNMGI